MELCKIYPQAKKNGKDSQLFKDALNASNGNRDFASYVWGLSQTPSYMQNLQKIEYDWNGEPTLQSFLEATNAMSSIDASKLHLIREERELGAIDREGNPVTFKSTEQVIDKVVDYNNRHEGVLVDIDTTVDGVQIKVYPNTIEKQPKKENIAFNNSLNKKLEKILNDAGFAISRQDNLSEHGIFDPMHSFDTAEGLKTVIRISNDRLGENAIPEEFSHLTIAGLRHLEITKRILNNLRNDDVLKVVYGEEYERYYNRYNGNINRLAEEAAGKLLQELLRDSENEYKNINTLLRRLWDNAKKRYSSIDEATVDYAIKEAASGLQTLSDIALGDEFSSLIDKEQIFSTEPLYKLQKDVDLIKESMIDMQMMYQNMLNNFTKNRQAIPSNDIKKYSLIKKHMEENNNYRGVFEFMNTMSKKIQDLVTNFKGLSEQEHVDFEETAYYLNQLQDLPKALKPMVQRIINMKYLFDRKELDVSEGNKISMENIVTQARDLMEKINQAEELYTTKRKEILHRYLLKYWGGSEQKTIQLGERKGQIVSLEQIMDHAERDVSFMNHMFVSLADSTDDLSKMLYAIVRENQNERDERINEYTMQIRALHRMLINSGSHTDFMLERNDEGYKTGRIISDIDFEKFYEERRKFVNENRKGKSYEVWKGMYLNWLKQNCVCRYIGDSDEEIYRKEFDPIDKEDIGLESRVEWIPKHGKGDPYHKYNSVFENMTEAQRSYYDMMMNIKRKIESYFPTYYVNSYRAIQITNDIQQIVGENMGNPKKLADILVRRAKQIGKAKFDNENYIGYEDNIHDAIAGDPQIDKPSDVIDQIIDEEESENGNKETKKDEKKLKTIKVKTNLSGEQDDSIPIMYIRHLDNNEDISNDFTASMMAYVASGINYDTMISFFNIAKLLKDFIMDRDVVQTIGSRPLVGALKSINGQKFEGKPVTKPGRESNIGEALQAFFDREFFGRGKNVFKVGVNIDGKDRDFDIGYLMDKFMRLTSMTGMALNEFAGINNDIIGRIQMFLEAQGRGFYTRKNLVKSELRFLKDVIPYLAQLNETNYNDLMHLLLDKFDVLDGFYEELKRKGYYQSNIGKIFGNANLMVFNNMGEFHMHVVNFYSIMDNIRVKVNGEETSFLDAFEVVEKDLKDLQGNVIGKTYSAEIKTDKTTGKSIVTDLNGNTIDESGVVTEIANKIALGDKEAKVSDDRIAKSLYNTNYIHWAKAATRRVGQRLFGAYNSIDRGGGNRTLLFRAVMQFRQWMPAHYERRFGEARSDIELGTSSEGFYRVFFRHIFGLMKGIKKSQREAAIRYVDLSDQEKGYIRQAIYELSMYATLCLAVSMIKAQKKDDDDDDEKIASGGLDLDDNGKKTFLKPYGDKQLSEMTPFERAYTRFRRQTYLQMLRTKSDIGMAIPWLTMPKSFLNIVEDPAAVTGQLENVLDIFNLMFLFEEVGSGSHVGENKWWNIVKKNIPAYKNVDKTIYFVQNANAFAQYE